MAPASIFSSGDGSFAPASGLSWMAGHRDGVVRHSTGFSRGGGAGAGTSRDWSRTARSHRRPHTGRQWRLDRQVAAPSCFPATRITGQTIETRNAVNSYGPQGAVLYGDASQFAAQIVGTLTNVVVIF